MITAITLCERLCEKGKYRYGEFHYVGVYSGNYIKKLRLELTKFDVQLKGEYVIKFLPRGINDNILNGSIISIKKISDQHLW